MHSGTPSPPDLAATPAAGSSSGPAPRSSGAGAPPAASNGAAAGVVTQTSTAAPAGTTVVKTSGVGCANDNSQNWYTNGMDGTWSEKAGGAGGCGRFVSMPMSGEPSVDGTPYVVWWFETSPVVTGACAVTVYIPSSGVPGDVAGHPAFYKILGGRTSSTVRASFTIDQTVNRGRWVSAGTFPLSGGAISIHLGNRGQRRPVSDSARRRSGCRARRREWARPARHGRTSAGIRVRRSSTVAVPPSDRSLPACRVIASSSTCRA